MWTGVHQEDRGGCGPLSQASLLPQVDRVDRVEVRLNPMVILASYLAPRPVIQTAVFRLLPSQTIERICALERLPALG